MDGVRLQTSSRGSRVTAPDYHQRFKDPCPIACDGTRTCVALWLCFSLFDLVTHSLDAQANLIVMRPSSSFEWLAKIESLDPNCPFAGPTNLRQQKLRAAFENCFAYAGYKYVPSTLEGAVVRCDHFGLCGVM